MRAARAMAERTPTLEWTGLPEGCFALVDGAPCSGASPRGVCVETTERGATVSIAPGARVEAPIAVVFTGGAEARLRVTLGRGASAKLWERHEGSEGRVLTEIALADDARLEYVRIDPSPEDAVAGKATWEGTVQAALGAAAIFKATELAIGPTEVRRTVAVRFEGEGATCVLDGLYVCDGSRRVALETSVDHAAPRCSSRQLYKGALDGRGHASFVGGVQVRQDAQRTDARQSNPNLLLSRDAAVETRPQLEILADDVKCTHGATVGRLSEEALFFLRARGIAQARARAMLVRAFTTEIVERIEDPSMRRAAERALAARVGHGD